MQSNVYIYICAIDKIAFAYTKSCLKLLEDIDSLRCVMPVDQNVVRLLLRRPKCREAIQRKKTLSDNSWLLTEMMLTEQFQGGKLWRKLHKLAGLRP